MGRWNLLMIWIPLAAIASFVAIILRALKVIHVGWGWVLIPFLIFVAITVLWGFAAARLH